MPARASVFLNVNDIDRALAFYKALGFRVTSSMKDDDGKLTYADLQMGEAEVGLGAIPSNDDPGFRAWVGTPLGAGVLVYLTLPRGGVDRVFGKARAAGAVVEMEPRDRPYGRVATINDPEGYVIALHEDAPKPRARTPARKTAKRAPASAKRAGKKAAKKPAKKAKASRVRR